MRRTVVMACLLAGSLAMAGRAEAQPRIATSAHVWEGWSFGAALGRSGNEDDHHKSDDRGADLRANVEMPLGSRFVVRVEGGRVSWEFDTYGPLHLPRDDVITVRRATIGLLGVTNPQNPVRGHIGAGVGLYHWGARAATIEDSITRGVHFTAGLAIPVRGRDWAITGEFQVHVMNSPNRTERPIPEGPIAGTAVLSLTHSIGFRVYW